jgi:hypothetical protein
MHCNIFQVYVRQESASPIHTFHTSKKRDAQQNHISATRYELQFGRVNANIPTPDEPLFFGPRPFMSEVSHAVQTT